MLYSGKVPIKPGCGAKAPRNLNRASGLTKTNDVSSVRISTLRLPFVLARVRAGFPSPAEDFVEGTLDLNDVIEHPAATYFIRVGGDSMVGAGIYDGDLLIVDRSVEAKAGHVVIAAIHGELTVKRLKQRAGRWVLVAENPAYPEIELPEESLIWGVVRHALRDLT